MRMKIKIIRWRPLMTSTSKGIKSLSEVVYYPFPSLSCTKRQQIRIWPISLMITALRFLCTCTVMDDPKSSTCVSHYGTLLETKTLIWAWARVLSHWKFRKGDTVSYTWKPAWSLQHQLIRTEIPIQSESYTSHF